MYSVSNTISFFFFPPLVENPLPVEFRAVHRGRAPAQEHRHNTRPAIAVPRVRRGPGAVAWRYRSDGAHRSRVGHAAEHDGSNARGARQIRAVDQRPEGFEHTGEQHAGRHPDGHSNGALRSGVYSALQPR